MKEIYINKKNNENRIIKVINKIKAICKKNKFMIFISPWLIGFVLLTIIPMITSFFISFTEWDILTDAKFVGFDNYKDVFQDPLFYKSLRVTLVFTALSVPINVVLSLLVAILLNSNIKCINLYRTIYYLPAVVSGVVVSLLWSWIFNSEFGLLNNFLLKFGIEGPRWLADEFWVMPAMVIMSAWGIGGGIIMYLSGLQGIPAYLYESARLDAANWWTRLTKITIPSMSPVLFFTTLTSIIGSLQTFTSAYVMTNGGPNNQTLFYAYYIYKHAFTWRQMGKASALAWLLFFIIMGLTVVFVKFSKNKVYYESKDGGDIL
jgi:multiple sugar transport system permease protein